jgi:hypothetical protein
MNSVPAMSSPSRRRDLLGAALLSTSAVGALAAALAGTQTIADAGPDTQAVETWRVVGFAYFSGAFLLLALAPRQLRGLWELTIMAKLALPLSGVTFLRGSAEAGTFVVADGAVTIALLAAYLLMAGWAAPPPHRWRDRNGPTHTPRRLSSEDREMARIAATAVRRVIP